MALSILALQCVSADAARLGRLRGVICDQTGAPLVGATIAIFDAASDSDEPIRNALTDGDGKFTAAIAPGRYVLRAVASGFSAVEARALVAANRETILDTIALRRVNTLAERRRNVSQRSLQAARSARGHVLHMDEAELEAQREREDAAALALTDQASSTHGVVQAVAVTGRADYVATNFAVSHRAFGSDMTIVGQTGMGDDAPQRVEAVTKTDIGESHRLALAFGYGRMRVPDGTEADLGQYTLQATDRWQVAGPVVLVYGVNYSRFSGASDADALLPRLGVEVAASPQTQIFAGLQPGSSLTEVARFDMETGEVTFTEPAAVGRLAGRDGAVVPDRSRRLEAGFGHVIDEQSNFEVMAFVDTASGRGIGLLAVPTAGGDPEFVTGELNGRTSGVRVLYTRRISDVLTGTVGYAAGRGQRLAEDPLAEPVSFFEPATFNVIAARLEAEFDTGTRLSAGYRYSPRAVIFAIDPFAGRLTTFEPSASFFIAQSLPSFGFLPGRWEATLDVRNLFDSGQIAEDGELALSDYRRLVRAGLSLRF